MSIAKEVKLVKSRRRFKPIVYQYNAIVRVRVDPMTGKGLPHLPLPQTMPFYKGDHVTVTVRKPVVKK